MRVYYSQVHWFRFILRVLPFYVIVAFSLFIFCLIFSSLFHFRYELRESEGVTDGEGKKSKIISEKIYTIISYGCVRAYHRCFCTYSVTSSASPLTFRLFIIRQSHLLDDIVLVNTKCYWAQHIYTYWCLLTARHFSIIYLFRLLHFSLFFSGSVTTKFI